MKVAIIGSRNCENFDPAQIAKKLPEETTQIISGGARGIDTFAAQIAKEKDIELVEYLPDYALFGRQAPIFRNIDIVKNADLVLAFWDYRSRGTAHAISECIRRGIPFQIIGIGGE